MNLKKLMFALAIGSLLPACATKPGQTWTEMVVSTSGAVAGGALGIAAAKALASYDGKRLKLSKAEIDKRERGYMVSFALIGAAAGASLANSVYGKLQAAGKKEREAALLTAAQQGRQQRYGEPTDKSLKGTISPGQRYADVGANRECVDIEDTLTDGTSREAIFVKMCRSLPTGGWQQVTA